MQSSITTDLEHSSGELSAGEDWNEERQNTFSWDNLKCRAKL
jgi:hypothetical protein